MNYFVTAIGTDSGKTLVSAILTEMLGTAYWKPVQAGYPRDTDTVKSLVSDSRVEFFEEQYLLQTPASPHHAAAVDGVSIRVEDIEIPDREDLVIEGAGGLLVPLNSEETILDLIRHLQAELILVSNLYLGSINHTLLTVEVLKQTGIPVKGIIFNGPSNPSSEEIILAKSGYACLGKIPQLDVVNRSEVRNWAEVLRKTWK
jgi:dethiobiotin synthetase